MESNIVFILVGLLTSLLLFSRFPMLKKRTSRRVQYKVSIIIPARNEEQNIALLLDDLTKQTYSVHEIICVDDCSVDRTADVVRGYGNARLVSVTQKPDGWTGKSWACCEGASAAQAELLLFLDADVRLMPDAVESLVNTYHERRCVISVLPYHTVTKCYERLSFFFNMIQVGANGIATVLSSRHAGLCGPVILIPANIYQEVNGHESVKSSIVDDVALGAVLAKEGHAYRLYMGKGLIHYRMYSGGFKALVQGWTKNFATGALKTPLPIFVMTFIWISSLILTVFSAVEVIFCNDSILKAVVFALYILWTLELYRISRSTGSFGIITILCYPLYLSFFLLVFFRSLIKVTLRKTVTWKDREIRLE